MCYAWYAQLYSVLSSLQVSKCCHTGTLQQRNLVSEVTLCMLPNNNV